MLKKWYGLFLGLLVLTGSACVTPTHASSASVVITHIKAAGPFGALDEAVVLYNNSSNDAEINDWCVTNKSGAEFACVIAESNEQIILPAYTYAVIVSNTASIETDDEMYAAVYDPPNQSSGAIVASSDTISLLDADNEVIDTYSWTSSLASTHYWARIMFSVLPDIYIDTHSAADWQKQVSGPLPVSELEYYLLEEEEPLGELPEEDGSSVPTDSPTLLAAVLTELLPNAIGSDTNSEFIEIHNPNEFESLSLEGYVLAIGPHLEKKIVLGVIVLEPRQYVAITNATLSFTLINTSSMVSLIPPGKSESNETALYHSPLEGEAWALIDGTWQYTNQPTPNFQNSPSLLNEGNGEDDDKQLTAANLKPCAANQYRSEETNRCRLLTSATANTPAPCKVGQERNPETNRCRNIATATSIACKEGQERNPETNRCRNVKEVSKAEFGVKGATIQQQSGMGWYVWLAIGGVIILIIGYGIWEWREEIKKAYHYVRSKFAATPK